MREYFKNDDKQFIFKPHARVAPSSIGGDKLTLIGNKGFGRLDAFFRLEENKFLCLSKGSSSGQFSARINTEHSIAILDINAKTLTAIDDTALYPSDFYVRFVEYKGKWVPFFGSTHQAKIFFIKNNVITQISSSYQFENGNEYGVNGKLKVKASASAYLEFDGEKLVSKSGSAYTLCEILPPPEGDFYSKERFLSNGGFLRYSQRERIVGMFDGKQIVIQDDRLFLVPVIKEQVIEV